MVHAWNDDNRMRILGSFVADLAVFHLVVRECDPGDPGHPAVHLGSDCQDWCSVILNWIFDRLGDVRAPEEHALNLVRMRVSPRSDA